MKDHLADKQNVALCGVGVFHPATGVVATCTHCDPSCIITTAKGIPLTEGVWRYTWRPQLCQLRGTLGGSNEVELNVFVGVIS